MDIRQLQVGMIGTNCYIVRLSDDRIIVMDPGADADRILSCLKHLDLIVLTHAHWDHLLALPKIKASYPSSRLCVHSDALYSSARQLKLLDEMSPYLRTRFGRQVEALPEVDEWLAEGSSLGPFSVLHTPGHSPGSICLHSAADKVLFSGDTLFDGGYGRTDLPGGDEKKLFKSLGRLADLPPETVIYPGHGSSSTIGATFRALGL